MTRYPCDTPPALAALGFETRTCAECGEPFTSQGYRRRESRFCTPECSRASWDRDHGKRKETR